MPCGKVRRAVWPASSQPQPRRTRAPIAWPPIGLQRLKAEAEAQGCALRLLWRCPVHGVGRAGGQRLWTRRPTPLRAAAPNLYMCEPHMHITYAYMHVHACACTCIDGVASQGGQVLLRPVPTSKRLRDVHCAAASGATSTHSARPTEWSISCGSLASACASRFVYG